MFPFRKQTLYKLLALVCAVSALVGPIGLIPLPVALVVRDALHVTQEVIDDLESADAVDTKPEESR